MFRTFKSMVAAAVIVGVTAGAAVAQGYRDAGAKASGQFGTGFYASPRRAVTGYYRSARTFAVAPQIVRVAPMPRTASPVPQVAQNPTERRSFSAEPTPRPVAPTVPAGPRVTRSYSYQPAAPVYQAPGRVGRSNVPTYMLPKTDSRKFGG